MNREIKFRARRVTDGQWVYGDLVTKDIYHSCTIREAGVIVYGVDPETVGQYVGRKDAAGNDVYEGDIFRHVDNDGEEHTFMVWWLEALSRWSTINQDDWFYLSQGADPEYDWFDKQLLTLEDVATHTIIGNLYDHPHKFIPQ